jgi:hypothetical protein
VCPPFHFLLVVVATHIFSPVSILSTKGLPKSHLSTFLEKEVVEVPKNGGQIIIRSVCHTRETAELKPLLHERLVHFLYFFHSSPLSFVLGNQKNS